MHERVHVGGVQAVLLGVAVASAAVPKRSYWTYSGGLLVAWVVVFALTGVLRGSDGVRTVLLVFAGFVIGWISTTIARYIYPPPGTFGGADGS